MEEHHNGVANNFGRPPANDFDQEQQQLMTPAPENKRMMEGIGEMSNNTATPNVGPQKKPLFMGKSTVIKTVSASKPALGGSAQKVIGGGGGAGLFKKPGMMNLGKKKF